jgi:hypothetical protein
MKLETAFEVNQVVWWIDGSCNVIGPNHVAQIAVSVTPGDKAVGLTSRSVVLPVVGIIYKLVEHPDLAFKEDALFGGRWRAFNEAMTRSQQGGAWSQPKGV